MVQRPRADDVTAPYSGVLELVEREIGVSLKSAKGPFVGPCDIGFLGVETAATDMVLEIDNNAL